MHTTPNGSTHAAARPAMDSAINTVQAGVVRAMAVPQRLLEAQMATSAELLTFVSRRMQAQAELWQSLGRCHDMGEAARTQRQFLERVSHDYTEEMTQLVELARRNFTSVAETVGRQQQDAAPAPAMRETPVLNQMETARGRAA
jgi:hypothetical protein